MIGRLPTAAAISLLMAICSVCGFISALVTSNMSTTYPLVFETTFPVVPTPSPSMVDDYTAPSLAVNPLLFADVLPLSVAVPDIYNDTFDSPPPIVIGDMAGLHGIGGIIIGGGGGGGAAGLEISTRRLSK